MRKRKRASAKMAPSLIYRIPMFKKFVPPALVLASLLSLGACKRESPNPLPAPARVHTEAHAPQPQSCSDHFVHGEAPRITNPKLDNKAETLCFNVFSVLHSGITRTPLWSAEHLQAENIAAAQELSRENSFHSESRLPSSQRAELSDYSRSGYDRGHMAPNGDMPDRDSQRDSFSLANIVPQDGENNRNLWAGIEGAVRKMAKKEGDLYSGDMTEEGVKKQFRFGEPKNPKGSVKFWVKDGVLTKFETKVEAKMEFNGEEIDASRTTTTEIKDVGATKLNVPAEAKKKLS